MRKERIQMLRPLVLLALITLLPCALPASEFDCLVREFSHQTGSKQTHIPFLGLARFVVAVGHPEGTSELKLAVFEHANLPPSDFARVTDSVVGPSWNRIVRARSRNGESTSIYTQQAGKHLRVLVATVDHDDATFVEVRIQPERLMKFVDDRRR